MFGKGSHANPSVSWGGFGAVWAQVPRQAKETDSRFATSCTLAKQVGPHQNHRPLQIFIISPLLTSLLIFLRTKEILSSFFPLFLPHFQVSVKRPAHVWYYQSQGLRFRHSCSVAGGIPPALRSCALPLPLPASPGCSHSPSGDRQLSSPATNGRTWGSFMDTSYTSCICNSLQGPGKPHPDPSHYPYHHPPCTTFPTAPGLLPWSSCFPTHSSLIPI